MSKFHAIYGKGGDTPSPGPGGDTYGEVQTLLWENPNPKLDFAPQKVTIDLSEYDGCIIEFNADASATLLGTRIKSGKTSIGGGFTSVNADGSFSRTSVIASDGVTFNAGYLNGNISNGHCIPAKIYGYKQYKTGSIAGEHGAVTINANTDINLDADSYYLLYSSDWRDDVTITASKGTVITSMQTIRTGSTTVYGGTAILKTDSKGILNTNIAGRVKKLSVGD